MAESQQDPGADKAFIADLEQERDTFRTIHHTLESEQAALARGDVDRLVQISKSKMAQFVTLGQLAEKRNRYLAARGLASDVDGMERWLSQQPGVSTARALWNELLASAQEARILNEANGASIGVKMQHNQQALSMLQQAANQAALYDPSGRPAAHRTGRPLDKA
ncbi:MAG: flagella synthesis protein FlgN [Burkholderiales bacterium]|nr:flagellar protein FlgN [Sulfuricellaceae bacterium]